MHAQSSEQIIEMPSASSNERSTTPVPGPTPGSPTPIPEILDIEQVAAALRCSVDAVRHIDYRELPRYNGPGRKLLFLEPEVVGYVRRNRVLPDEASREAADRLEALARDVRSSETGRSRRRSARNIVAQEAARC